MDKALLFLQKFADDAKSGRIPKDRLPFGAPWRHPPPTDDAAVLKEWAKLQLMDFVQSLVHAEFGVTYFFTCVFSLFYMILSVMAWKCWVPIAIYF